MKRIVIPFILSLIANFAFSQENVIPKEQLETLKQVYKWNDEKILLVNFYLPKNNCHYNQYDNLDRSKNWIDYNIYNSINLINIKKIYVYSDKFNAIQIINNKRCFEDYENYFLKNFFNASEACFGIVAINSDGKYSIKIGEFTTEDVNLLLKNVN
jgi:hypothetical protein